MLAAAVISPSRGIRCRHRSGNPDCDCYPVCPECDAAYDPAEGHDCLDVDDLGEAIDSAKALRDALDRICLAAGIDMRHPTTKRVDEVEALLKKAKR